MLTPSANRGDEHAQGRLGKPENAFQTLWNKGKLISSKSPVKKQRTSGQIPTKLQVEERTRDSAMFNLAIHNKLRGRDVVRPKAEGVAAWHEMA